MNYIDVKIIENLLKNAEILSDLLSKIMQKAQGEFKREINENNNTNNNINNINNNNNNINLDISKTNNNRNKDKDKDKYKDITKSNNNIDYQSKLSENKNEFKKLMIKPFNLTKSKPKVLQEPIKIPNKIKAKEVPLHLYKKKSLKKLEEERKERLESINKTVLKKYKSSKTFELKTAKRPTNIDKISKEVNQKREQELQFDKKYSKPLKDFNKSSANIKYNETAILREEHLIKKKQKDEEAKLNKILVEKKDSKEFERWKREMEERDNLLRDEEITKRKLELDLNREIATEYFQQRILENKLKVAKHKEEENLKMAEKQENLNKELEKKKLFVKEIEKEREFILEEKEKMIQKNKENYTKQADEYNDLVLKANEEKKIEENRRKDIIMQIRELERLPIKRTKGFDPTETCGHGLLEEMSIAELKERLELQKAFYNDYLESKKEENKLRQAEKNEELVKKANLVMSYRDQVRNNKEIERKNKLEEKTQKNEKIKSIREKSLLETREKINNKKLKIKKEEEILEKKIREIKLQRQYLQQGRVNK